MHHCVRVLYARVRMELEPSKIVTGWGGKFPMFAITEAKVPPLDFVVFQ